MLTFWDSFLNDYGNDIKGLKMVVILEAFFRYCRDDKEKVKELLSFAIAAKPAGVEIVKKSPLDFEKGYEFTCGTCGCEYKATLNDGQLSGTPVSGFKLTTRCPQCDARYKVELDIEVEVPAED